MGEKQDFQHKYISTGNNYFCSRFKFIEKVARACHMHDEYNRYIACHMRDEYNRYIVD